MNKIMYLYEIKNNINGKIYIGIHSTNNLNDGYFGSGTVLRKAINKYGKENFTKTIIAFYDNIDDLIADEKKIVDEHFIKNKNTYNIELGGRGGKLWTKALRKKMSEIQKQRYAAGTAKPWCKGLSKLTDERVKRISDKQRGKKRLDISGKKNGMYGIDVSTKMSKEANEIRLKKIKKANTGKIRTDIHKENYSKAASNRIWLIQISTGNISHTTNQDDPRLNDPDWKKGRKE